MSRLEQLFEFLREDPSDPFNLYAIATEYMNIDISEARKYYEKLLTEHADYLPTYYHAAKLYEAVNAPERAAETYEKGMALAQKQGEHTALRELTNAYNELMME